MIKLNQLRRWDISYENIYFVVIDLDQTYARVKELSDTPIIGKYLRQYLEEVSTSIEED
jgi:hypothetical protein